MLPTIRDFSADGAESSRYARLDSDWWVAAADVSGSTALAQAGRDRDVNYVAGAVIAVLSAVAGSPDHPLACQFGGDGAVAVIPPDHADAVRQALAALGWWSDQVMAVPLRVAMIPVGALDRAGHPVLAALHDFGNGNVFGQFLGSGVPMAEAWMKSDPSWLVPHRQGDLPGLADLSCRWDPIPARRGRILCVIIDAADPVGAADVLRRLETVVPTEQAAPLGDGGHLRPPLLPRSRVLDIERRATGAGRFGAGRFGAMLGSVLLGLTARLGGRLGRIDARQYLEKTAERSDYRKLAGGPRLVLDVTADEETRIIALLDQAEAKGEITYGLSRCDATTMTCMVGDFFADRHVHFVDGQGLGYWRAAVMLKAKLKGAGQQ